MNGVRYLFGSVLLATAWSVSAVGLGGDLPVDQRIDAVTAEIPMPPRSDWRTAAGYRQGPPNTARIGHPAGEVPNFGAQLFAGGFSGVRADDLNPDYRIVPGDRVTLRIWGALDLDRVMTVDAQGNLFIPAVGPVNVQGVTHSQLDARVRAAVRTIYPENVHVYTSLQGVQPVAVFVTGFVNNPGRYAGTPNDAILYFLDQAGGIDEALGSYRDIRVVRNGATLAQADLYRFLLDGELPRPQFREGDTVVVGPRGPAVTVTGDVERSHRYELLPDAREGQALLELVRPKAGTSHVLLQGNRATGPLARYHTLEALAGAELQDGDHLVFSIDQRPESIVVQVEGSFYGPSRFVVPRDTRLHELLDNIAVPADLTDVQSISVRRKSVAERQRHSLEESLRRLETTYLAASSATGEEAQIRVREAELIARFVERASQVEPTGRMVVSHSDRIIDIRLQDGDVITIPERSDSLLISGEVLVPQSAVFTQGRGYKDYIEAAGGYTRQADRQRVLVVRKNGEVRPAAEVALRPGDEILVLPAVPTKNLQLASTLSQILYQIAIAAKVVLDL